MLLSRVMQLYNCFTLNIKIDIWASSSKLIGCYQILVKKNTHLKKNPVPVQAT